MLVALWVVPMGLTMGANLVEMWGLKTVDWMVVSSAVMMDVQMAE
jgi:hypothetical protein